MRIAPIVLPLLASLPALLAACSDFGKHRPIEIHFEVERSVNGSAVLARNLQFYIHDVELLDREGKAHPFVLAAAAPWQHERVALIDLAGDAGTQRHSTLRGTADADSPGTYSGVRFTVGVPFDLNHTNPLTAAPPLDRSELFWTWQSGHKFLRADLADGPREWSFHLGSTGCSSASALRPPSAQCARPNRIRVELKGADPLQKPIRLHLDVLIDAMQAANGAICTGDYEHNAGCADAYASTGLQPQSGTCAGEHCSQQLWTLAP